MLNHVPKRSVTDSPETAFGGEWPADAIERLVATVPELDPEKIVADHEQSTDTRLVFVIEGGVCPDCGGAGEYVGLSVKETCGTCGGSGRTVPKA